MTEQYLLCLDPGGYEALSARTLYEVVLLSSAQARVVGDSGSAATYPRRLFAPLDIPDETIELLRHPPATSTGFRAIGPIRQTRDEDL